MEKAYDDVGDVAGGGGDREGILEDFEVRLRGNCLIR